MPQLDLLTFFTQFFWSVLCLFLFYFFVSKLILPELTRVLKYRSKAGAFSTSDSEGGSSRIEQAISDMMQSQSSASSAGSALYEHACQISQSVLMAARQKRDSFRGKVATPKKERTPEQDVTSPPCPDSSSPESEPQKEKGVKKRRSSPKKQDQEPKSSLKKKDKELNPSLEKQEKESKPSLEKEKKESKPSSKKKDKESKPSLTKQKQDKKSKSSAAHSEPSKTPAKKAKSSKKKN